MHISTYNIKLDRIYIYKDIEKHKQCILTSRVKMHTKLFMELLIYLYISHSITQ